jgi:hypothetical protein
MIVRCGLMSSGVPEKLNNKHKLAALLEARGELNITEIAEAVDLTLPRLSTVRNNSTEYKLLVERYRSELVDRTLDEAARLISDFNKAAPSAFQSLDAIHKDTGARDGARVAAAREILDRAPIAPKKRTETDSKEAGIHIHLGVQSMQNIRAALEDVDDSEIIDLLDNEYSVEEAAPEQIGEAGPLEAKEAP